ncbi:hypothetical protein F5884DRAFT_24030 [Xylogone sp. PMI_703]|nr:hypothetical protein F5884DRAFT_24030 [Xylogone sp. PMI_703]
MADQSRRRASQTCQFQSRFPQASHSWQVHGSTGKRAAVRRQKETRLIPESVQQQESIAARHRLILSTPPVSLCSGGLLSRPRCSPFLPFFPLALLRDLIIPQRTVVWVHIERSQNAASEPDRQVRGVQARYQDCPAIHSVRGPRSGGLHWNLTRIASPQSIPPLALSAMQSEPPMTSQSYKSLRSPRCLHPAPLTSNLVTCISQRG